MVHFLILHVTLLLIVAFFVLFAASKAEGLVSLFGNILGAWVILAAILHVVAYFSPGLLGMKAMGPHEGMMHEHWMHHWGEGMGPAPAAATPAPATAAPAAPAPATPAKPAAPAPKKS